MEAVEENSSPHPASGAVGVQWAAPEVDQRGNAVHVKQGLDLQREEHQRCWNARGKQVCPHRSQIPGGPVGV